MASLQIDSALNRSTRRRPYSLTVCPLCSNSNLSAKNLDQVTRDIGFCEDCLINIFPFNGIVDELEFNMAVKGTRYLPNFDYLRIQKEISLIKILGPIR